jgi:hypothetical protein
VWADYGFAARFRRESLRRHAWVSLSALPGRGLGCGTGAAGGEGSEARRRIREALALALDDDAAAKRAKLIDDVRLPADARRALEQARAARARLANESKKAQESTARAVRTLLKGMHLSVRDAGDLIGISPQRVHQLAHENG